MEEQKTSYLKFVAPISVVAVIIIAAVVVYATQMKSSSETAKQTAPTEVVEEVTTSNEVMTQEVSPFKDGTYEVTGNYVSPGGPRDIDVTVTLKDGVITDSTFVGKATDPASKRFQGEFAEGYKAMVIGKPLEGLEVAKVSGSSLTPKGFNDALDKIREEAKS